MLIVSDPPIRTFGCQSGPFPDLFLQKSPDPDQSPEKTDHLGALQTVNVQNKWASKCFNVKHMLKNGLTKLFHHS